MQRILLISSSMSYGSGYLDHCERQVRKLFEGVGTVLFVPYALRDLDAYAARVEDRFRQMDLGLQSIHRKSDPVLAVEESEGVFIGGGNTFRLVRALWEHDLLRPIRSRVARALPYMGTSAGSNVACPTIKTTNDMPITEPPTLEALGLVPFQLNPHYLDPDPSSRHMGESRDTRLKEFHEENASPVVALREGAMLKIDGDRVRLEGSAGGKLFRQGREAVELSEVGSLDFLLHGEDG